MRFPTSVIKSSEILKEGLRAASNDTVVESPTSTPEASVIDVVRDDAHAIDFIQLARLREFSWCGVEVTNGAPNVRH